MNIYNYHLIWYLLGIIFVPRLTIMIFLSLHIVGLPLWFMIIGWFYAICSLSTTKE